MDVTAFERAFRAVLEHEGGFVDDPRDSGGATNHGITERVARAHGFAGNMIDLPLETAKAIAKAQYWDTLRLDDVAPLSYSAAFEMFDTGYNMGVRIAGMFLQGALNALNRAERDYPDVTVDGIIGPVTVAALRKYLSVRGGLGEVVLLRALNVMQGARYLALAEKREKDEAFVFGWLANRVNI